MPEPNTVYLLEVFSPASGAGRFSSEELRADLEARDGVQILGLLVVPVDEAVLCLLAADAPTAELAIHEVADRYGPGARVLHVRWAPFIAAAGSD